MIDKVVVDDYPQLRFLAWQLGDGIVLTGEEALGVYERNWRHVDVAALTSDETALIRRRRRTGRPTSAPAGGLSSDGLGHHIYVAVVWSGSTQTMTWSPASHVSRSGKA